jgi:hypothetical protein
MKRIAMIGPSGLCASVAAWDGVSAWAPVAAGLCASTEDVTASPQVGPGWTYSGGTWTAPPAPAPTPDPAGFLRDVAGDAAISDAGANAVGPWFAGLAAALSVGDVALIKAQWARLVNGVPLSAADKSAIVAHATAHAIPGIS